MQATIDHRLDLIRKAKAGDHKAFNTYAKLNEGLLQYIVRRYDKGAASTDDTDDLMQEALIGLHKGIDSFNLEKNAESGKPEGYIFSWVRAYVGRFSKKYGIREQLCSNLPDISGEQAVCETQGSTPADYMETEETEDLIQNYIQSLPWRKRIVAEYRLCDTSPKKSLREIGDILGVSHERVRQMEIDVKCDLLRFLRSVDLV